MKLKCGRSIGHIIKHAVFKCQMAMKRICGIFCNCFIMWERRFNMNDIFEKGIMKTFEVQKF